jgi:hypothetical protein
VNPVIETVKYDCFNGKTNTIIVIADYNTRTMVLKEHSILGPSLTNTIEYAIEKSFIALFWRKSNRGGYIATDWTVLQDCGEEGIFKITFDLERRGGMTTNGGRMFEKEKIANPKWEYFSKDLKTFDVLYGKGEY